MIGSYRYLGIREAFGAMLRFETPSTLVAIIVAAFFT